jgi:hypothetical protein
MNHPPHKFAVLDVCQRLQDGDFRNFCASLKLNQETIDAILADEVLTEEQFYKAFKTAYNRTDRNLTFDQLKISLLSVSRTDLIILMINRINNN